MFSEIAGSYDTANSVLSLGIHHLWKQKLVKMTPLQKGDAVLDCATGTGDLALLFKKKVVTGKFQLADVTKLQFEDNSFNASSISFGIRNVENRIEAYKQMARVTKSGGHVMILEFGQIQTPGIRQAYNFYSQKVLPFIGGVVSGKPKAYQYLNDSSMVFPCGKDFKAEVMSTGLYEDVEITPLSFGVAYIYKCKVK